METIGTQRFVDQRFRRAQIAFDMRSRDTKNLRHIVETIPTVIRRKLLRWTLAGAKQIAHRVPSYSSRFNRCSVTRPGSTGIGVFHMRKAAG